MAIQDEHYRVQVSNNQILKDIKRDDLKKIMSWSEIEVGDIVKVKENGSQLYYEANIISRNEDGSFNVRFDDEQVEENITADRIMKVMSGRIGQQEWVMFNDLEDEDAKNGATKEPTSTDAESHHINSFTPVDAAAESKQEVENETEQKSDHS